MIKTNNAEQWTNTNGMTKYMNIMSNCKKNQDYIMIPTKMYLGARDNEINIHKTKMNSNRNKFSHGDTLST